MNNWKFLFSLLITALMWGACANETEESASEEAPQISVVNEPNGALTPAPAAAAPAGTVMHYICPKGCAGSGGPGAGTCPTCGSEYVHNDAYHQNQPQQTTPPAGGNEQLNLQTVPPPTSQEPPQNAKGVWHYTCPKGCAGGAGAAGPCPKCGTALAHNPVYHQ